MSGLFRNLVAQAMGLPPRMRPAARPGFEALAERDVPLDSGPDAVGSSYEHGYFPEPVSRPAQRAPRLAQAAPPREIRPQAESRDAGRGDSRLSEDLDVPDRRDAAPARGRSERRVALG